MELLADQLEESLFNSIVNPWYPRCIDTLHGGYISTFNHDWTLSEGNQNKAIVHQSRHLWTLAMLYDHYPEQDEFLAWADHGFRFIKQNFQDPDYGGFYYATTREGAPDPGTIGHKRVYGQAFAIHGLARYYKVSKKIDALEMAINAFRWMDKHARDGVHGGYFEVLKRDGTPESNDAGTTGESGNSPLTGLKEFNSSLHILEAFTELYMVWPDPLLRERLEEMYLLFRDRFVNPEGYLHLFFYPDWTLVPDEVMVELSGGNYYYTQHITFGHDVETAFLMLEAAHALGLEDDKKALELAKKLVDHALAHGWDRENGGFYYAAYNNNGERTLHLDHKAFWVESEGLNALMLMHGLHPDEDYFGKFRKQWQYIDTWLIDKEHGGWYNYGLDTYPENIIQQKSHNWKTTYHDARAMVNCINMLRPDSN
ncbi:MAG: AGE family epimerase/isomerase [Bacteroidales bacterium]